MSESVTDVDLNPQPYLRPLLWLGMGERCVFSDWMLRLDIRVMLEHVRNYEALLGRLSEWGRNQSLLFVYIFCHWSFAYPFDASGATD